jgi:diguanylate cyclase (GGDEF)-like protein
MDIRMRRSLTLAAAAVASVLAVLLLGVLAPGLSARLQTGEWGQALAEGFGAAACALAARRLGGQARLAWFLFAAAQGIWALTDFSYGLALSLGADPPEVSPFDIGWLAFYAPLAAALFVLYRRLRPERGWQGALDGLIVCVALGLFSWVFVLGPAAASGSGGVVGTVVNSCYPVLDLLGLLALGWLCLRQRGHTPSWLWWVLSAFGVQVAADLAYLVAAVNGLEVGDAVSAATFMVAGWLWVFASRSRNRAPARAWAAGSHTTPPSWSRVLPFLVTIAVAALATARPERPIVAVAMASVVLLAVRGVWTLHITHQLILERDRLLVTDPLTGAYNRRFLEEELERAQARADRGDASLAAIAFDLDRFKQVNDRFGHGAGDELLARVAAAAQRALRRGDLLFRLGGDEFLILCPATTSAGALQLAERVRLAVRRSALAIAPEVGVTASLGVAAIPEQAGTFAELLARADAALYRSKQAGRDRALLEGAAEPAAVLA